MDAFWIALATLVLAIVGGVVPVVNVEAWVFGVSAVRPRSTLVPVVLAAAVGQAVAKALLYRAGGGAAAWAAHRRAPRLAAAVRRMEGATSRGSAVVFASALAGLPPLYAVSVAAGAVRFCFPRFVALTLLGRLLRFAVVFLLPRMLWPL